MFDKAPIAATAAVKITKFDERGNVVDIEEHVVKLTEEEAKALWLSQKQE